MGGCVLVSYRQQTPKFGIFTPYSRFQTYRGGYRNVANAPFGRQHQLDVGLEWQIRKEMELALEYSLVDTLNFAANSAPGALSHRNFDGSVFRAQFQVNLRGILWRTAMPAAVSCLRPFRAPSLHP